LTSRALLTLTLVLCGTLAQAGRGKKRPEPAPPAEPAPPPEPELPPPTALFDGGLPVEVGALPTGLANLSAQGCTACHYQAHDGWLDSRHATGHRSPRFSAALAEIDNAACSVCHLPISSQRPQNVSFDAEDIDRPVHSDNPTYDATLHTEGVSCAACHVRDGRVIGATPPSGSAPHASGWSPELTASSFCGTCHQLTWPGANQPLYDTFGEWQRSPHGQAGISCQSCHMGPGATGEQHGANHAFDTTAGRGVSVLVDIPAGTLVRGGAPLSGEIILQNTGAGHAWPTGSPFRGIRLEIFLEATDGDETVRAAVHTEDLVRSLEDTPPYQTLSDTRLAAGEERRFPWEGALEHDAPAGPWSLVVLARPTVRGETLPDTLLERRVPLRVE